MADIIIIFVSLYYGYGDYGQNSDYLSSQQELFFVAFEKDRRRRRTKAWEYTLEIIVEIINPSLYIIYIYNIHISVNILHYLYINGTHHKH